MIAQHKLPAIHPDMLLYEESNTVLQTELLKYVFVTDFIGLLIIIVGGIIVGGCSLLFYIFLDEHEHFGT
jgi:hypothetical protein